MLRLTKAQTFKAEPKEINLGTPGKLLETSECRYEPWFQVKTATGSSEGNGHVYLRVTRIADFETLTEPAEMHVSGLGKDAVWLSEERRLRVLAPPVRVEVAAHGFLTDKPGELRPNDSYRPVAEAVARMSLDRLPAD